MTRQEVEAIVRRVIVERSMPFDLLDVVSLPAAWEIRLRHQGVGNISVKVSDGRPIDLRRAIQDHLEEQF